MKILSRFASPAGFALVLLLFFVVPFVSVSCDVPGYGEAGVDYTGGHLISGADPTPVVPDALNDLSADPTAPTTLEEPPPDPGVQILAIIVAALAAAGVLTVLIPQLKARLFGGAAVAGATLVMAIVTMVVAQGNLQTALMDSARETGAAEGGMDRMNALVEEMVHTELGFWLVVVVLAVTLLGTLGAGLLHGRPVPARAGGAELAGLPFPPADEPDETAGPDEPEGRAGPGEGRGT